MILCILWLEDLKERGDSSVSRSTVCTSSDVPKSAMKSVEVSPMTEEYPKWHRLGGR